MTTSQQWVLASRPAGEPVPENFRLENAELPALQPGQLLVKNLAVSVDPYMRGRMNDVKSYTPPFQLDQPMEGGAVGEVVESSAEGFQPGEVVLHFQGWRDYAVVEASAVQKVDTSVAPARAYLGALGMTGLTAYAGLAKVAELKAGDVVFISGAAGAVGSIAGQIAKALGARAVIGSAGSPEKVQQLLDLGFDAAFNYKEADDAGQGVYGQLKAALAQVGADGIDVYFDNVGGEHLEAAISAANTFARFAICGAISQYNLDPAAGEVATGPRNFALVIGKQITLKGYLVNTYSKFAGEYAQLVGPLLADGTISYPETVRHGVENIPQAFIDLLNGANTGKMTIEL